MLILTRKPSETITIGNQGEIQITILAVKGNQIRIGVDAPKDIAVNRSEIWNRIKESQKNTEIIKKAE